MAISWMQELMRRMGVSWVNNDVPDMTIDEAVSVPAIRYAISKITSVIAQVPFQLYKNTKSGKVPAVDHRWYYATKAEPNEFTIKFDFFEAMVYAAVMYGDARIFIDDVDNELWQLPFTNCMTVWSQGKKYHVVTLRDKDDPLNKFAANHKVKDRQDMMVFDDSEVIHIKGLSSNGLTGSGVLDCKQTFRIAADAEGLVSTQLNKGFSGSLMLEAPAGVFRKQEDAEEFLEHFTKTQAGKDNAGKPGLLREGIKANLLTMSNNDAQMVELRRFNREDVALLFGLEMIIGQDKSVSYSSAEQKNQQEVRNCFTRWTKKITEEFAKKLLTDKERRSEKYCFDFDFSDYLKPDAESFSKMLLDLRMGMVLTANEVREQLGYNRIEGGDDLVNPATLSQAESSESDKNDSEDAADMEDDVEEAESKQASKDKATEAMLRRLINTEIARVNAHANEPSKFMTWLENWYASWELKIADTLEEIGIDRDCARLHCEESKRQLLECCDVTAEELPKAVKDCTSKWSFRLFRLMEATQDA